MHARAILGLPVDVTLASPGASAVIYGGIEGTAIGFENVARALAVPETDVRLFGKPESQVRRRMGVVTATADDVQTARRRAKSAAAMVTRSRAAAPRRSPRRHRSRPRPNRHHAVPCRRPPPGPRRPLLAA